MENKSVDILKTAILMERKGAAFYSTVADQTTNADVRKIFTMMAEEEKLHIKFLSEQFLNIIKNNKFEKIDHVESDGIAEMILSDEIRKSISAAGYEAAAISAAIDMETKAIEVYSKRAKEAEDENEKQLYTWLAEWEQSHHKILHELNEQLKEEIWYDNQFWPF